MATAAPCACTHTNVLPNRMVALSSMTVSPDNSLGHLFFYDRNENSPFLVPRGWSFVVTDIIIFPATTGQIPNPNRFVLAVVSFTNGSDRVFEVAVTGDQTVQYGLTGAYVIPAGHAPQFRNTTFSNSTAEAKLLGYFVQAVGLNPGQVVF
jgi:hypothetical protein